MKTISFAFFRFSVVCSKLLKGFFSVLVVKYEQEGFSMFMNEHQNATMKSHEKTGKKKRNQKKMTTKIIRKSAFKMEILYEHLFLCLKKNLIIRPRRRNFISNKYVCMYVFRCMYLYMLVIVCRFKIYKKEVAYLHKKLRFSFLFSFW